MAINKVVYGTKTLVDLTSDTVDAAHLAKGYTAHDAAGNIIAGTLEQQENVNFLEGVTPSLLNGATQVGKTYFIPSGGSYGMDYIEYQLDIPTLTADTAYYALAYGNSSGGFRGLTAMLYYQDKDGSVRLVLDSGMFFSSKPTFQVANLGLSSGVKPTKLVFSTSTTDNSLSISSIVLMAPET